MYSTFHRARRQEAYRRLGRILLRRPPQPLLTLDEVSRRLGVFRQSYVGVRAIPVDRIVGTVSRVPDFDRDFLPQTSEVRDRWRQVEFTFERSDFPPIAVYEVDGRYFVTDGHHRVAIAKQREVDFIDAEVTSLETRWKLPPDADIPRLILAEQERMFIEESGLGRARPEARIEFTRPPGYIELLEQIKVHGYHLMRERGEAVTPEAVAGDWYDRVYRPTVEAIHRERLDEVWPRATEADLFLWVTQRRRELFPERGGLGVDEAVRAAKEDQPGGAEGKTARAVKRLAPRRKPRENPKT